MLLPLKEGKQKTGRREKIENSEPGRPDVQAARANFWVESESAKQTIQKERELTIGRAEWKNETPWTACLGKKAVG